MKMAVCEDCGSRHIRLETQYEWNPLNEVFDMAESDVWCLGCNASTSYSIVNWKPDPAEDQPCLDEGRDTPHFDMGTGSYL